MISLLNDSIIGVVYRGSTALAAADITAAAVFDVSGYESVMLYTTLVETTAGASTSAAYLQPMHGDSTSSTGLTSLGTAARVGSATLSTADNGKALAVDIYRPTRRYVGAQITRPGAGETVMGPIVCIGYNAQSAPVAQSTGEVIASHQIVSPTT